MRKKIESTILVSNKVVTDIKEELTNTGAYLLEREPRTQQLTKDIIDVLKKHNLIDKEDDIVKFWIQIQS